PFAHSSLESLEDVRQVLTTATHPGEPLHGSAEIGLAGSTSAVNDLKNVTTSDQQRMYILVTLGVYAILVALLRRPGICLYLILTVVLGYLASLGVTELVFRSLHHGTEPWGGLDCRFLSVRDPCRRGRGLQHPAHGPRDRGRGKARHHRGNTSGRSPHRRH